MEYNHDKIVYWSKKKSMLKMLLKGLMSNVENLLLLSKDDFNHYISVIQEKKNEQQQLISDSGVTKSNKSTVLTISS